MLQLVVSTLGRYDKHIHGGGWDWNFSPLSAEPEHFTKNIANGWRGYSKQKRSADRESTPSLVPNTLFFTTTSTQMSTSYCISPCIR
mmetsp:Transcript_37952/g.79985  ORF Transcript_37952/g.79985 Transcript_37952/m.79985 type:complete len:87 (-) Transcript_37952:118-378(-)